MVDPSFGPHCSLGGARAILKERCSSVDGQGWGGWGRQGSRKAGLILSQLHWGTFIVDQILVGRLAEASVYNSKGSAALICPSSVLLRADLVPSREQNNGHPADSVCVCACIHMGVLSQAAP